jgi:hypothetical protein
VVIRSTLLAYAIGAFLSLIYADFVQAGPYDLVDFDIAVQEDFHSSKLTLITGNIRGHLEGLSLVVADNIYHIDSYFDSMTFVAPADSFVVRIFEGDSSTLLSIVRTRESLISKFTRNDLGLSVKPETLRIPSILKNQLYWFDFRVYRKFTEANIEIVKQQLEKACLRIGAIPIFLPPGDYGGFMAPEMPLSASSDSTKYTGLMFFWYTGSYELFLKTFVDLVSEIECNRCPTLLYREPNIRIGSLVKDGWKELLTEDMKSRLYEVTAKLDKANKKIRFSFSTRIDPDHAMIVTSPPVMKTHIDFDVRETDLGTEIRPYVATPYPEPEAARPDDSVDVGGAIAVKAEVETRDLYFISYGDTCRCQITIQSGKLSLKEIGCPWIKINIVNEARYNRN